MTSRIRCEPGKTTNETDGCTRPPRTTCVTDHTSSHEPFVQEPAMTCSTAVPATSSIGTTRSGEPGSAINGVIAERSTSMAAS